jgi:isopentenyl-diphosphate Delta-isomerase
MSTNTPDPGAEQRKSDHIDLAFRSQIGAAALDARFHYEPLFASHPEAASWPNFQFMGKMLRAPMWVSSMTGGTQKAGSINRNLAQACGEFGMGMGLGSCRQLLHSREHLADFAMRKWMGHELPFFANLGIAQLETLLADGQAHKIAELVDMLEADGLIIHVNPMQEALQPEGDRFIKSPLETIERLLDLFDFQWIVKEVGQGFGPKSIQTLLKMPLTAIEFAAAGGTNFAKLELLRSSPEVQDIFGQLAHVGHTAEQMLHWVNHTVDTLGQHEILTRHLIISGGIQHFLDGYYLVEKSALPAVYGQASAFLRHAQGDYEPLRQHVAAQLQGLSLAKAYLVVA